VFNLKIQDSQCPSGFCPAKSVGHIDAMMNGTMRAISPLQPFLPYWVRFLNTVAVRIDGAGKYVG